MPTIIIIIFILLNVFWVIYCKNRGDIIRGLAELSAERRINKYDKRRIYRIDGGKS